MEKELLQKRIQEIKVAIEQSAGSHNCLLGRLAEATFYLEQLEKEEVLKTPDTP